jgi:hypothetical protein
MSEQLFRDTYKRPSRRARLKIALAGFITHPAVIAGQVAFLTGVIAAVIVVVVTRGWL